MQFFFLDMLVSKLHLSACTLHVRIVDFMQSVKETLPQWQLSQKKKKSRLFVYSYLIHAQGPLLCFFPLSICLPPPLALLSFYSLPSGHLQVVPGGGTVSAVSTQQSLHHRGGHALRLPERLLPRRHGQTGGHLHQWVIYNANTHILWDSTSLSRVSCTVSTTPTEATVWTGVASRLGVSWRF